MAVRALTEVFEIPHPGSLMYEAFDKKQRTILVPTLGLKREEPAPPPEKPREETAEGLRKLVLEAIREGSGNADLEFDTSRAVLRGGGESHRGRGDVRGTVRGRAREAGLRGGGQPRRRVRRDAAEGVRGTKGVRGRGGRGGGAVGMWLRGRA